VIDNAQFVLPAEVQEQANGMRMSLHYKYWWVLFVALYAVSRSKKCLSHLLALKQLSQSLYAKSANIETYRLSVSYCSQTLASHSRGDEECCSDSLSLS